MSWRFATSSGSRVQAPVRHQSSVVESSSTKRARFLSARSREAQALWGKGVPPAPVPRRSHFRKWRGNDDDTHQDSGRKCWEASVEWKAAGQSTRCTGQILVRLLVRNMQNIEWQSVRKPMNDGPAMYLTHSNLWDRADRPEGGSPWPANQTACLAARVDG